MGKLTDRLKELSRGGSQPVGFAPAAPRPSPPAMLVMASVEMAEGEAASQAAQSEADAVLAPVGPATTDDTIRTLRNATRRTLMGAALTAGGKDIVDRLQRAGCDFVLLSNETLAADILTEERTDKVLEIEPAWSDIFVREIERLPVEAVLFRIMGGERLSLQQYLQCLRVASLARKPVLVMLPGSVGTEALQPLRDAGVSGVVVPVSSVKAFRSAARSLPPPRKPKERLDAILPMGLTAGRREPEEEDEPENA